MEFPMKENLICKTKWFWPWQDQEEEIWLEEMSKKGLHFQELNHFGKYTFEQGVPVHYAYRLDYQDSLKDEQQYLQLFQDSGWRHLDTSNGWRYFRQEVKTGKTPEIFTDAETKIKKYERVKVYSLSGTSLYTLLMLVSVSTPEGEGWRWWFELCLNGSILLFFVLALALSAFIYFKLENRIQELRSM
jgi:hypothetical protein